MPDELKALQRLFAEAVLVTGPYFGQAREPVAWPRPCWFRENIPGIDTCGGGRPGVLEAAHWIKRQQVERWVHTQFPWRSDLMAANDPWRKALRDEIVALAAWDPRNAVPACEHHHRRFDGHHVPLPRERLVVPRALVPAHVIEFSEDYGMETFIEDKHPLEV